MCSGSPGMVAAIMGLLWESKGGMTPEEMRTLLLPEQEAAFKEMAEAAMLLYNNPSMESEESEGEGSQVGGKFGRTVESGSGSQAPPPPPPPQAADAAAADADGPPPAPPADPSADAAAEVPEADV